MIVAASSPVEKVSCKTPGVCLGAHLTRTRRRFVLSAFSRLAFFSPHNPVAGSCGVVRRKKRGRTVCVVELHLLQGSTAAVALRLVTSLGVTGQINRPDELLSVFGPSGPKHLTPNPLSDPSKSGTGTTLLTHGFLADHQRTFRSPGPVFDATLPSFLGSFLGCSHAGDLARKAQADSASSGAGSPFRPLTLGCHGQSLAPGGSSPCSR